ncbi:MAG: VWA domain-containing protein [Planctomycetota bacterium]|nr:VWA domain-containing protein [Planctomycetota bacterium]
MSLKPKWKRLLVILALLLAALIAVRVIWESHQEFAALTVQLERQQMDAKRRHRSQANEHFDVLLKNGEDWRQIAPLARARFNAALEFAAKQGLDTEPAEQGLRNLPAATTIAFDSRLKLHRVARVASAHHIDLEVVTPAGEPISRLSTADFRVESDTGTPLHYAVGAATVPPGGFNIALLMDCSTSMTGPKLETARDAANNLVSELLPQSRCKLFSFATNVVPLTPWTNDSVVVAEGLRTLRADGHTCLNLALATASRDLSERPGKKHLIVCTDGKDTTAAVPIQEVITLCRTHAIAIHAIAIEGGDIDHDVLRRLTRESGGSYQIANNTRGVVAHFQQLVTKLSRPIYRIVLLTPGGEIPAVTVRIGEPASLELRVPLHGSTR